MLKKLKKLFSKSFYISPLQKSLDDFDQNKPLSPSQTYSALKHFRIFKLRDADKK